MELVYNKTEKVKCMSKNCSVMVDTEQDKILVLCDACEAIVQAPLKYKNSALRV
jgi:hypothetical protein